MEQEGLGFMKPIIWIEIHCDNCGDVIGWNYHDAESISKLKKAAKDWIYNKEYGNLCPECQKRVTEKGRIV